MAVLHFLVQLLVYSSFSLYDTIAGAAWDLMCLGMILAAFFTLYCSDTEEKGGEKRRFDFTRVGKSFMYSVCVYLSWSME